MAEDKLPIYDSIDRPYDSFLNRDADDGVVSVNNNGDFGSDSVESQIDSGGLVKSGSSLSDIWIETWIKSRNYQPKTQGFLIDARLGYIECMKLYVGGGGIIGGSLDIPDTVTTNSFHVESDGDTFWGTTNALFNADNDNAPAYILKSGVAKFQKVTISGGSNVTFISDTLDTSSKSILKDFTFSPSDYSGAFKSGDITWNTTTGVVTGGSGVIMFKGGIVGANSGTTTFSIDASTGAATFAGSITGGSMNINNKFLVTSSGDTTLKSVSIINQFLAGENLVKGKLGVFKNYEAAWGNDSGYSDRSDCAQTLISAMVRIDAANPNTNYSSAGNIEQPLLGTNSGGENRILVKLDLTSSPPGLPDYTEVESVKFRIYVKNVTTNTNSGAVTLTNLTSAFDEATVTYNTKPTTGNHSVSSVTYTSQKGEGVAASADLKNLGYFEFDITQMYRMWKSGDLANHGFELAGSGANAGNSATIGGRTYETVATIFKGTPFLSCLIIKNNPGSGNTITACDGKIYTASNSDYQRIKNIAGIIGANVSSGDSVDIYSLSNGLIIPSSIISIDSSIPNRKYYLTGTDGSIGSLSNDIIENDKWDIKIGKASTSGLMCELDKKPIFIKSETYASGGILPPPGASMAIIKWTMTGVFGANYDTNSSITKLEKDRLTNINEKRSGYTLDTWANLNLVWASGIHGLLSLTATESGYDSVTVSATVYWYA